MLAVRPVRLIRWFNTKLEFSTKEVVAVIMNGVDMPNQILLFAFSLVFQEMTAEFEVMLLTVMLVNTGGVISFLSVLNEAWDEVAKLPAKSFEPTTK